LTQKTSYARRMLLFLTGQTLASLGCALMVALDWGADAYNIIVQGLSARSGYAHGTMSSLLQLILLLLCIPWGRRRIGPGTLICVVLVGVVINLTTPLLLFTAAAPPAAAAAVRPAGAHRHRRGRGHGADGGRGHVLQRPAAGAAL